jgi:serine/threonine protein kinase/tetratricopeptide (TPR) repeat protein
LAAHGTPDDPGERAQLKLGRYEVVRELGKGAMGIVYLAKDPLIGRLVALKTIRASAHADDDETQEFQQRFIREAQAAGILNHPNIVTVHDIGQDDALNMSFIAMEYVEGQNLKEVLSQGRTLTFDQIADIVAQVAEAIDFAHAKGIVHRDVKPANIILLDGHRAKITDFGIAKIASGAANLTTTGQFLGTPNYMAPEQIKGAPVDGRTDIFALGICLYECLTRRKPFGGDSLTSISYKIVHEPFPPLHEINPQIPEGFEDVVANCLAKEPAKRYQRGRDLANALRAVIRGERPIRPPDPVLAEETVLTRERIPTMDVPFPQAVEPEPPAVGGSTRPRAPKTVAVPAPPPPAKAPKAPSVPFGQRVKTTMANVRRPFTLRQRINPAIFFGIVAILVAGLVGAVALIRSRHEPAPVIDARLEAQRAKERELRRQGNVLLRQGRVTDAYAKFEELARISPKSPYVTDILKKLEATRQQEEVSKLQLVQSQQRFDEGLVLFNQKKFADAAAKFQEALTLNPNSLQAAEYLKSAQAEEQKLIAKSRSRTTSGTRVVATATAPATETTATTASAAMDAPAMLTTFFQHPFKDGQIVVRVGNDVILREQLFTETPARFLRRAARNARQISATREIQPKNADVQIWITVPGAVQEHHTMQAVRFNPGASLRLTVHYDAAAKHFSYELN